MSPGRYPVGRTKRRLTGRLSVHPGSDSLLVSRRDQRKRDTPSVAVTRCPPVPGMTDRMIAAPRNPAVSGPLNTAGPAPPTAPRPGLRRFDRCPNAILRAPASPSTLPLKSDMSRVGDRTGHGGDPPACWSYGGRAGSASSVARGRVVRCRCAGSLPRPACQPDIPGRIPVDRASRDSLDLPRSRVEDASQPLRPRNPAPGPKCCPGSVD